MSAGALGKSGSVAERGKRLARFIEAQVSVTAKPQNANINGPVLREPVANARTFLPGHFGIAGKTGVPISGHLEWLYQLLLEVRFTRTGVVHGQTGPFVEL